MDARGGGPVEGHTAGVQHCALQGRHQQPERVARTPVRLAEVPALAMLGLVGLSRLLQYPCHGSLQGTFAL